MIYYGNINLYYYLIRGTPIQHQFEIHHKNTMMLI